MTRLTPDAHDVISRTTTHLVSEWTRSQSLNDPQEVTEVWEQERNGILGGVDFNWVSTGSGRIVCGISRTLNGSFAMTDGTPVVVKFEPWIDVDSFDESASDNHHEITTWRLAVERGDTDLFAPLYGHGDGGRWLVMEECLPIFSGHPGPTDDGHGGDYLIDKQLHTDADYINRYRGKLEARGWSEHDFKHGNVGLRSDESAVLVDYGSFTKPPDP